MVEKFLSLFKSCLAGKLDCASKPIRERNKMLALQISVLVRSELRTLRSSSLALLETVLNTACLYLLVVLLAVCNLTLKLHLITSSAVLQLLSYVSSGHLLHTQCSGAVTFNVSLSCLAQTCPVYLLMSQ